MIKLLQSFKKQLEDLGELKYAWFTSFNINIEFIETYLLPAILGMDPPRNRMDYEHFQLALNEKNIDLRIFCDRRFMGAGQNKRTAVPVHGFTPAAVQEYFSEKSLFHPKVIYLEDVNGKRILGAGSANLTLGGWARNQEVFHFAEIETKDQYKSVREFFDAVADNVGLGADEKIKPRKLPLDYPGSWAFVHSFQDSLFVNNLFDDENANDLMVWSPYLPEDLAGFIHQLELAAGRDNLVIHLVPDRQEGQFIRTPWTPALKALVDAGKIRFYQNPVKRHENAELCHAKVWKLGNKLAIGSWNFTGPGSNVLLDAKDEWLKDNNIEAGIVLTEKKSWKEAVGAPIAITSNDFLSKEQFDAQDLQVPADLPFDIHVTFDWAENIFYLEGRWLMGATQNGYAIKLPDVKLPMPLIWKKSALHMDAISVSDPQALLMERRFEIYRGSEVVFRGLIAENRPTFRPVQAYDTLSDLLDDIILGGEPSDDGRVQFRLPISRDSDSLDCDPVADVQVVISAEQQGISYFRLFQAMQQYSQKLDDIKNSAELDRWVFGRPGCLFELVNKVRERISSVEVSIFEWFLAQEVQLLCKRATARQKELDSGISKDRWNTLILDLPSLPDGMEPDYLEMIRKGCGYGKS